MLIYIIAYLMTAAAVLLFFATVGLSWKLRRAEARIDTLADTADQYRRLAAKTYAQLKAAHDHGNAVAEELYHLKKAPRP